jgi:hypothetical protein
MQAAVRIEKEFCECPVCGLCFLEPVGTSSTGYLPCSSMCKATGEEEKCKEYVNILNTPQIHQVVEENKFGSKEWEDEILTDSEEMRSNNYAGMKRYTKSNIHKLLSDLLDENSNQLSQIKISRST